MWYFQALFSVYFLVSTATAVNIVTRPENVTALRDSSVVLDCAVDEENAGFFEWRVYSDTISPGQRIYALDPNEATEKFPDGVSQIKFSRIGKYGLNISELNWKDAAVYMCYFLSGDKHAMASVVVIDALETGVISPMGDLITVNTTVQLSCTLSFGGPKFSSDQSAGSLPVDDYFPRLQMSLGDELFDEAASQYEPGKPGVKIHTLMQTVNYTVSINDVDKLLTCVVSTHRPEFTYSTNRSLSILAPAHDITISSQQMSYAVGDSINCSAKGRPTPHVYWQPLSANGRRTAGTTLTITEDMIGPNVWKCVAVTEGTAPTEMEISFNVTSVVVDPDTATGGSSKVGLAVGLTLGLIAILGIALVIIFLVIKRRRMQSGNSAAAAKKKKNGMFVYSAATTEPANNTATSYQPGARPIYQPPTHTPPVPDSSVHGSNDALNRSGYGDLGMGLGRFGNPPRVGGPMSDQTANDTTTPLLNNSALADPSFTQPNRSEPVFDAGWQPANYNNIPPPPASVGSRSATSSIVDHGPTAVAPGNAMGFADDKADGPPAVRHPPRASNRSFDQSTNSGSSHPPTETGFGRPPRGAGPMSDSSLDQSDASSTRLPGVGMSAPGAKGRLGRPPGPPPKKPDVIKESQADDFGTVV